jgi:hypothetical protein
MTRTRTGLVLDEMFSPAIAAALRDLGHEVVAITERGELRAMTDDELFAWTTARGRWLLTETSKTSGLSCCARCSQTFPVPGSSPAVAAALADQGRIRVR